MPCIIFYRCLPYICCSSLFGCPDMSRFQLLFVCSGAHVVTAWGLASISRLPQPPRRCLCHPSAAVGLHTRDHGHLPPEEHLVPQQISADSIGFQIGVQIGFQMVDVTTCHYMSLPMCCMRVSRAMASACSIMFLKFLRTALKTGLISFANKFLWWGSTWQLESEQKAPPKHPWYMMVDVYIPVLSHVVTLVHKSGKPLHNDHSNANFNFSAPPYCRGLDRANSESSTISPNSCYMSM